MEMDIHDDVVETENEELVEANANGNSSSLLQELRETRREVREGDPLTLTVLETKSGAKLVAQYRRMEWDELRKIGRKYEQPKLKNHPQRELLAQCDTIVQACVGLFIQESNGDLVALEEAFPQLGEGPIRYEKRLAEWLGFEADTARSALRGAINNDVAVAAHHNELAEWMQSSALDLAGDVGDPSTPPS